MIVFVCAWLKMYKFIFFLIKLQYSHKKNVIETLGMILEKKKKTHKTHLAHAKHMLHCYQTPNILDEQDHHTKIVKKIINLYDGKIINIIRMRPKLAPVKKTKFQWKEAQTRT